MESLLDDLIASGLSCAPHVLTALARELGGDPESVRQVAATLTSSQRQGLRPLPAPLPVVDAISRLFRHRDLTVRDREFALASALCLDDRLAPLLAFDGRCAREIATSGLRADLHIRAGRIRLLDPRLAIWLQRTATPDELAAVHQRLSVVFADLGDRVSCDWHRARASLQESPESAPELIRIARELSETGDPARALQLAREAAAHASGAVRDEAGLVAGTSATGAGLALEAAERLGSLFPDGMERWRLQGLGGLLVAQSFVQGGVPDVRPSAFRPRTDDSDDWYAWTRAAALGALLCAERGDRSRMRVWLDAVREGSARVGAERELRDPAVALSWLLVGEEDLDDVAGTGPFSGRLLRGLRSAVAGEIEHGLHLLAGEGPGMDAEADPLIAGFEHSPVVQAYLAVAEVLMLVWRGDIGIARELLIQAALRLPVAIPFAGLGVVLARRLDVAVLGEIGPFARALTRALPPQVVIDLLVDRSLQSSLAGAFADADAARRLWLDRGSPQSGFAVPGIDGAEDTSNGRDRRRVVRPPDLILAAQLQRRVASMTESDWRVQREQIRELTRGVRSPFSRAHIEAALGAQSAIHGDHVAAREHLRLALRLYEISGATAWARSAQERLARWDDVADPEALPEDSLAGCRRAWAAVLTVRENEVAMRAVDGSSNREIADALGVSVRTVEVHLGRVFAKLDVRTRVGLTVLAHRTNQLA